ncbi:MAG: glycoside hydrolase family 28 protein [Faecalibacterium sp.]
MNLSLVRSMTRSAVFELENDCCFRPEAPFTVALDGVVVYEACNTNVFSLYSLLPGSMYTVTVTAGDEVLTLPFETLPESFFVDASRYGIVGDGVTDNTGKLQAALSTCPPGGTVYVPAGRYRTASLFLKSHTTLYLEKDAVLLGDNDRTHYPILPGVLPSENEVDEYYLTGWEGNPLDSFAALINVTQAENVVITGQGTLDADAQNGDWWKDPKKKKISWRPRTVAITDSENVVLHGVTVQNSYSWTIHPMFTHDLDLLDFRINNPYNAPNTDGIDPESCVNTRIIGANIHVGDDCIAMKASKVYLGMKLKKSCEHTIIRNCLLDKGHGGIVIGSEMSGGVKDMVVTQCLMDHTDRGLRVKTRRGRGETAVIDGLVFRNVEMRGVKAPFVINMFYFCDPDGHGDYVQCRDALPVDEYTPKLGTLTMEDITATDAQFAGCYFDGLPEMPIERVSMRNVSISFDPNAEEGQAAMADNRPNVKKLAIYAENVKEIDLHNVKIEGYEGERLHFANVGHFEED